MKKSLILAGMLSIGYTHAQVDPAPQKEDTNWNTRVGFNTQKPQASVDIKELLNGANPIDVRIQGMSLPNFTTEQREKFGVGQTESMKIGTLIYNTTKKCIEMYKGYYDGEHQWSCDLSGGAIVEDFYIYLFQRPLTCKQFGELDESEITFNPITEKMLVGNACINYRLHDKYVRRTVVPGYVMSNHTAMNYNINCYKRISGGETIINESEVFEKHERQGAEVECVGDLYGAKEIRRAIVSRVCYDTGIQPFLEGNYGAINADFTDGLCGPRWWANAIALKEQGYHVIVAPDR